MNRIIGDDIDVVKKESSIESIKRCIIDIIIKYFNKYEEDIYRKLQNYKIKTKVSIVNPVMMARYFDIEVKSTDLSGIKGLKGFYAMDKDKNDLIFLDEKENSASMRNIIAHEIAHCLLIPRDLLPEQLPGNIIFDKYSSEMNGENKAIENLCDKFARDLLMPKDEFFNIYKKDYYGRDRIGIISDHFNVEYSLAKKRAEEFGLVS